MTRDGINVRAAAVSACTLAAMAGAVPCQPESLPSRERDEVIAKIELALFPMLPPAQRETLARAELAERFCLDGAPATFEDVAHLVSPEAFENMRPVHRLMLATLAARAERGEPIAPFCFAPDMDPEAAFAFDQLFYGQQPEYQQTNRWSSTASGPTGGQGDPITLTYSFPPDGTFVPNINGFSGNNQLNAWMNGLYGDQAAWQPLFDQVFARWSQVMGVRYVYEPNDDGVTLNQNAGVLGVRGDLRIAAIPLDGNSGILAYNNFPNDGDMVLDAFDSFYNVTASNSLRLRNVAAHEHGHGSGMLHVCPANQTKLMEPFISTAYDGPQNDDVQNGNRHYGDRFEFDANNSLGNATDLGAFAANGSTNFAQLSIDDNTDQDYYKITVSGPHQLTFTATPIGSTYLQGTQTSACNTGSNRNSLAIHDLRVRILASDGVTVLADSNAAPIGAPEGAVATLPVAGTYYLHVFPATTTNDVQIYRATIDLADAPFIPPLISLPDGAPALVAPGLPTPFAVTILPNQDTLVPGSALLNYRGDGGAFQSIPLTSDGGTSYTATIPAAQCADAPQFFISVEGTVGGLITNPVGGAADPYSATVGAESAAFSDTFQSDLGWTVTSTATDGQWNRGTPVGGGDRGDPPTDGDGSGQCYLTDNVDGNSDVDAGTTTLTSPAMNAAGGEAYISYWRWFDNTGSGTGAAPGEDTFLVEVSNNNGSTWTNLETVGPGTPESSGGWFFTTRRVNDVFAVPSDQFRIRFIAQDTGAGSVVEAGVDGVSLVVRSCTDAPPTCPADLSGSADPNDPAYGVPDGLVDASDFFYFLDQFAAGNLAVADLSGSADPNDPAYGIPD
ncbi:MAG: matrixin family metalloprotease, partial [Phycisphaerales bacterium]|nr:matrixin family metalloprotease [Phycisphaerales bacterium]